MKFIEKFINEKKVVFEYPQLDDFNPIFEEVLKMF